MYFFGFLNLSALFVCQCLLPSILNNTLSQEEIDNIEFEQEEILTQSLVTAREIKKITWCTLLGSKACVFTLLTLFMGTFNITFWTGFIGPHFSQMGLNDNYTGYVLGAQSFTYLVACLLYPKLFESAPRRFMFVFSILLMVICVLLLGPS